MKKRVLICIALFISLFTANAYSAVTTRSSITGVTTGALDKATFDAYTGSVLKEILPTQQNLSSIGAFTDWTSLSRIQYRDGDYHQVQELNADPGFEYWFTFEGVSDPQEVRLEGVVYDGANNHDAEAQIKNFTNSTSNEIFDELRVNAIDASPSESDFQHVTFSDEAIPYDRTYAVPSPTSDYVSNSGETVVKIIHPENGATAHDMYIDKIGLIDR